MGREQDSLHEMWLGRETRDVYFMKKKTSKKIAFGLKRADLHSTRDWPRVGERKINHLTFTGRVWVKKANAWMSYIKYNREGKTDEERWETTISK